MRDVPRHVHPQLVSRTLQKVLEALRASTFQPLCTFLGIDRRGAEEMGRGSYKPVEDCIKHFLRSTLPRVRLLFPKLTHKQPQFLIACRLLHLEVSEGVGGKSQMRGSVCRRKKSCSVLACCSEEALKLAWDA